MTFDAFWASLVLPKPRLADPDAKVTMTARAFREQLRRAYVAGADECLDDLRGPPGETPDFLRDLFGRR